MTSVGGDKAGGGVRAEGDLRLFERARGQMLASTSPATEKAAERGSRSFERGARARAGVDFDGRGLCRESDEATRRTGRVGI